MGGLLLYGGLFLHGGIVASWGDYYFMDEAVTS